VIPADIDRLRNDVAALAGLEPPRNYRNIASLNAAARYIREQFSPLGCRIEEQAFESGVETYRNILCSFGPESAERVVVGAHYDVAGDQPGADDNASAVAGLLEIGRLLAQLEPDLKHRVDLAAYTLEEPPFFYSESMGSAVHAKSLADAGVRVKAMISLEMIGYFTDERGSQDFPAFFLRWMYPDQGNFIGVVGKWGQGSLVRHLKKFMKAGGRVPVHSLTAPASFPAIDRSDHLNFWKRGYPAVMITDTADYRNPNYHLPTDTIETLDFARMAEVVKGVYWAVVNF
jgi:Zn-dependent M28 family amino/carboxypeptidase